MADGLGGIGEAVAPRELALAEGEAARKASFVESVKLEDAMQLLDESELEHLEFLNDEHLELSTMWLNTRKNYTQKRKEIKQQINGVEHAIAAVRQVALGRAREKAWQAYMEAEAARPTEEKNQALFEQQADVLANRKLERKQKKQLARFKEVEREIQLARQRLQEAKRSLKESTEQRARLEAERALMEQKLDTTGQTLDNAETSVEELDAASDICEQHIARATKYRQAFKTRTFGTLSRYVAEKQAFVLSPRPGLAVDWEEKATQEIQRAEDNEDTLEWLQGQWLPFEVKDPLDAYEEALEHAEENTDMKLLAEMDFLIDGGVDMKGRPVFILCGANFPLDMIDPNCPYEDLINNPVVLYLIYILDPLVIEPYVIVYVNSEKEGRTVELNKGWLKRLFDRLPMKYHKNLTQVWMVHPGISLRVLVSAFVSELTTKVRYIDNISALFDKSKSEFFSTKSLIFPEYVYASEGIDMFHIHPHLQVQHVILRDKKLTVVARKLQAYALGLRCRKEVATRLSETARSYPSSSR